MDIFLSGGVLVDFLSPEVRAGCLGHAFLNLKISVYCVSVGVLYKSKNSSAVAYRRPKHRAQRARKDGNVFRLTQKTMGRVTNATPYRPDPILFSTRPGAGCRSYLCCLVHKVVSLLLQVAISTFPSPETPVLLVILGAAQKDRGFW